MGVLVLVALVLITIDYRQGESGPLASLRRGAVAVLSPAQQGLAGALGPAERLAASVGELWRLREEKRELEEEVERLRQGRVSRADLEREVSELRALLDMRERLGLTTTGAQVIARPPGTFSWTVLLDAGAEQGVRPGMAVIDSAGLVGRVLEVTADHARVELATSPDAGYAVRIAEIGVEGLLSGRGVRPFQLEALDPEAAVPPDAEVVTRSFEGSSIPDGIPVGAVREGTSGAGSGPAGRFLAVQPVVDFTRLDLVQVVLDAPRQPRGLPPDEVRDYPAPRRPPPPEPTPDDA